VTPGDRPPLWAAQQQVSHCCPSSPHSCTPWRKQAKGHIAIPLASTKVWGSLSDAPPAQPVVWHTSVSLQTAPAVPAHAFPLSVPLPLPQYPSPPDYGCQMFQPVSPPPLKFLMSLYPMNLPFKKNCQTPKPSAGTICLNNLGQQIPEVYYLLCNKVTPCFEPISF